MQSSDAPGLSPRSAACRRNYRTDRHCEGEMKQLSQPAYLKRWIKTARRELASEDYIYDDVY